MLWHSAATDEVEPDTPSEIHFGNQLWFPRLVRTRDLWGSSESVV